MQKIKCSVSAVLADKSEKNFDIELEVGNCPIDYINSIVQKRYVKNAIQKKEKVLVDFIRSCYIEEIVQLEKECSFYGKSIMDFNEDDFQDFATEFCLMAVPLRKTKSIIEMQTAVALIYLEKVKGINIKEIQELYRFNDKTGERYMDLNYLRTPEAKKLLTIEKEERVEALSPEQKSLSDILSTKKPKANKKKVEIE